MKYSCACVTVLLQIWLGVAFQAAFELQVWDGTKASYCKIFTWMKYIAVLRSLHTVISMNSSHSQIKEDPNAGSCKGVRVVY